MRSDDEFVSHPVDPSVKKSESMFSCHSIVTFEKNCCSSWHEFQANVSELGSCLESRMLELSKGSKLYYLSKAERSSST